MRIDNNDLDAQTQKKYNDAGLRAAVSPQDFDIATSARDKLLAASAKARRIAIMADYDPVTRTGNFAAAQSAIRIYLQQIK